MRGDSKVDVSLAQPSCIPEHSRSPPHRSASAAVRPTHLGSNPPQPAPNSPQPVTSQHHSAPPPAPQSWFLLLAVVDIPEPDSYLIPT